jgi:hypothetical protein
MRDEHRVVRGTMAQSVRENPFIVADRSLQGVAASPLRTEESPGCTDPACRATHAGHRPYRHSLYCTEEKEMEKDQPMSARQDGPDTGGTLTTNKVLHEQLREQEEHDKHEEGKEKEEEERIQPSVSSPSYADIVHRHHLGTFHGTHHIIEHLSRATGHDLSRISSRASLRSQAETSLKSLAGSRRVPSSSPNFSIVPSLEPVTKAQAVASLSSFHYAEKAVAPGHPDEKLPTR